MHGAEVVTHDTDDEGSAVFFQDFMKMHAYKTKAFLLIYHEVGHKKGLWHKTLAQVTTDSKPQLLTGTMWSTR